LSIRYAEAVMMTDRELSAFDWKRGAIKATLDLVASVAEINLNDFAPYWKFGAKGGT
jgi:hypothetical protein